MKKILVHVCCAPCAAPSLERVQLEDWDEVGLYFSNSNIFPQQEYEKRRENVRRLAEICDVSIEEELYDHQAWLEYISGLEREPERGKRCTRCFEFNLARTSMLAARLGYDAFTTTLTLSPHKISQVIFAVGARFPGYIPYDFKKQNGFVRSLQLTEQYGFYRQSYCGCEFSIRTDDKKSS